MSGIFDKYFAKAFLIFALINVALYFFILIYHNRVSFNSFNYKYNAHHFLEDPRAQGQKFNFLKSLAQYDAQWYLKIASFGYSTQKAEMGDKSVMGSLSYAFFPLYPLTLSLLNVFGDIELTAFVVSNIFLILNFGSLYFVASKIFDKKLAVKAVFLLFLFPFSIFYRSYFVEGLQLFLLLWFGYFFVKEKYLASSVLLSLLGTTKGTVFLLYPIFFYYLLMGIRKKKISVKNAAFYALTSLVGIFLWILYCYATTGDPLYFYTALGSWFKPPFPGASLLYNMTLIARFAELPLHDFHFSKIDVSTVIVVCFLLIYSKKFLPRKLWLISLILWITPLVTKDTFSYSRYQTISYPLFFYLASVVNRRVFILTATAFGVGLFITSLYFVNWYWIG